MTHRMGLQHTPFLRIMEGTKTVEMRLYDEKRSRIQAGDTLVFEDTENGETMKCLVLSLHRYPTFQELYAHHDKKSIGYGSDETASPDDMLAYYPEERIRKYGVVGIELKVI